MPRLFLVALALVLALSPPKTTNAQPTDSTAITDSLEAALHQFERTEPPTATDSVRLWQWADSLYVTVKSLQRDNPSKARELYRQTIRGYRALSDSVKLSEAVTGIGITHFFQANFEEALQRFRESLQIGRDLGDPEVIADARNNIGLVHRNQGRFDEALVQYREVLQIDQRAGDRQATASTLLNIGVVHGEQAQYEEALYHFRKALQIQRDLGNRQPIAALLGNIGIVYQKQGQYQKALARHREALQIQRDLGDRRGIANTLNVIGKIHGEWGQYEEALAQYREVLQIRRETGNQKGIAKVLNRIGTLHRKQGEIEESLTQYQEALQIERDIGYQQGVAKSLNHIGVAHEKQEQYERALARYQKALDIRQEIGHQPGIAASLSSIGRAYLAIGQLRSASDTLGRAVHIADDLRLNATSPKARRSLLSTQIDAYRALTTAHVRSGRPDSALRAVEQARARLLADRLADTATGDTSFALPSVAELRRTLGSDEAALLYANAGSTWPLTALVVTEDTTVARELPDSTVRAAIENEYPTRLNRLRREKGPLTAALDTETSQGEGTPPSLAEIVRLYRYYLTREQDGASIQTDLSRRLHDLLVEPIADAIADKSDLIAVPTGALGYLPFETLQDSTGQHLVEDKHVRYAQSLTVLRQLQQRDYAERKRPLLALGGAAYTPDEPMESGPVVAEARRGTTRVATRGHAATLLRDANRRMKQGKSPQGTYQRLGYARWSDLPGTQSEVEQLGTIAGKGATVVTGAGASEDSVRTLDERSRLSAYRRVHFATHGVAVPEAPELSALVLSQTNASDSVAARDGYLTMEEIADLKMKADVAVLSACQTGLGKVVAGEGVVSLSHAFLRAGANATLVSQWKVLDKSTRQFMTAVYKRAEAEDTSFAEAVTETKRAFIAGEYGEKNTDPLRWAPFVYYGRE